MNHSVRLERSDIIRCGPFVRYVKILFVGADGAFSEGAESLYHVIAELTVCTGDQYFH